MSIFPHYILSNHQHDQEKRKNTLLSFLNPKKSNKKTRFSSEECKGVTF